MKSQELSLKLADDVTAVGFFNVFEDPKRKALKGFINLRIEQNGEFLKAYNSIQLIETEKAVFIKEPARNYKDKDGEWKESPFFIIAKAEKELLTTEIVKAILPNRA